MNKEQTKKAIAVMQAYVDGETIQYKSIRAPTEAKWEQICGPICAWAWHDVEYRPAPEIIKSRRFLHYTHAKHILVDVVTFPINDPQLMEKGPSFIRWIDTEWQETEL